MRIRLAAKILWLGAIAAIVGCQPAERGADIGAAAGLRGMISVHNLAGRLGMRVTDVAGTHVTLKNSANTVLIFTCTNGKVYVNAKPVAKLDRVRTTESTVYVPQSLETQIGRALRSTQTWPSQPAGRPTGCVVLDAGHGGRDPGATSATGYYEKTVNLQVANKTRSLLRNKGLTVVMTRDSDGFVELEERAAISNRYRTSLFVSIHADSNPDPARRGFSVFIARGASSSSRRAATILSKAMGRTGLQNNGIRHADYRVLVKTVCPAVLVELGHLSNYQEAQLIRNNAFQNRLASALAAGIVEYLTAGAP